MRPSSLLLFLLVFVNFPISGQIFQYNTLDCKYYYVQPAGETCSSPPNYVAPGVNVEWKSPIYNSMEIPGWVNNDTRLFPIGYAVSTSNNYGGLPILYYLRNAGDATPKPTTLYVRKTITLTTHNRSDYSTFTLKIRADDGVRIYFNEQEVVNYNLPSGAISANTLAIEAILTDTISKVYTILNNFPIHPDNPNKITITAEVHQSMVGSSISCTSNSSDMFFDMQLSGTFSNAQVIHGPYLQLPLPNGVQIRWKTNTSEKGKVCFSRNPISPTNIGVCKLEDAINTDHIVTLDTLTPDTKYFYSIQNEANTLTGIFGDDYYFRTPPLGVDTSKTTKIWVTGDVGQTTHSAQRPKVLAGFKKFKTERNIDYLNLWLLLGDVCNSTGSQIEYDTAFFATHDSSALKVIKQTPVMACLGNHDYYTLPFSNFTNADSGRIVPKNQILNARKIYVLHDAGYGNTIRRADKSIKFFDLFSFPANGYGSKYSTTQSDEKKGYYSYNHNNIHFICLDSYGFYSDYMIYGGIPDNLNETSENPQFNWLKSDLLATKNNPDLKWTIMYWHHSPYTRGGGHFSDSLMYDEFILYGIRERLVRYLDNSNYDIDLVLNGHSHAYSRSKLMKGHYGLEDTFDPGDHNDPLIDPNFDSKAGSSGKFNGTNSCAYLKSDLNEINEGIVYVLTGSSGQLQRPKPTEEMQLVGHKALNGADIPNTNPEFQTRGNIELNKGGSVYIEVKDNRLDAKFVQEDGVVADSFVIFKDINKNDTLVKAISVLDLPTESPQLQLLKTNWPNVKSFSVTGPDGYSQTFSNTPAMVPNPQIGPVYILKDQYNCISQKFRFTFSEKCWTDVTINNTINTPTLQVINATGKITAGNKILGSSNVKYNAGKSITLTPGMFFIQNPARFMTNIAAPNCQ